MVNGMVVQDSSMIVTMIVVVFGVIKIYGSVAC